MKIEPRYYLSTGSNSLWQNRKRLMIPAILSSVISVLLSIILSIDSWLPLNMQPVGIINNIGYVLLIFGGLYLSILAYICILLVAKECLDSKNNSLLESYKESTKYVWPSLWYGILFVILTGFLVPLCRVLISIVPNDFAKLCILLTGLLISLVILSMYNLVMISVVTDFQSKKHLRRSIGMVKNNFVPVMLIIITSYSFLMIPTFLIFLQSIELSRSSLMIKDITIALAEVILVPYSALVTIPLYRVLKEVRSDAEALRVE